MNMRVAKKLQPGAVVRESWDTNNNLGIPRTGLVIGKKFVDEIHEAKILGGFKATRYDIVVHWLEKNTIEVRQNWEIMLVSEDLEKT